MTGLEREAGREGVEGDVAGSEGALSVGAGTSGTEAGETRCA
jgi:hypothetical protein